jgi:hypothetical protein
MIFPNPEQAFIRLKRASELRDFFRAFHLSAAQAFKSGDFPTLPVKDLRSDVEYWKQLAGRQNPPPIITAAPSG